jgi:hypothetical protein
MYIFFFFVPCNSRWSPEPLTTNPAQWGFLRILMTFAVLLLIFTRCLSLFKSLGADSSKRPRTPLGAHQWEFYRMKDNMAFCNLQPNYVSCIIQKILMST